MVKYTEQEQKQIGLLKCWIKLSYVGGNFGKQVRETFGEDWVKLQEDFVDRLGWEGSKVYINKTMALIEDYIEKIDKEKIEADKTEACEDCGVELRIGSENYPSDHSIFNGVCDDCREEEEVELPIREDWFRTNAECVCEKKPDNDYPCICDEV